VKTCTKCGQAKPLAEFWPDRSKKNGYMARCKTCKAKAVREYRAANPDLDKKRYWADRDGERERHLIRKYGITLADYADMLESQGGKCAICGRPAPADRTLDVDHDHKTNEVRGLLCTSCNRMLGHSGDSADRLEAGAAYLRSCRRSRRSSSKRTSTHARKTRRATR
jgi:hypothetical protein